MSQDESIKWHCHTRVDKFNGDSTDPEDLYETIEIDGNLGMYAGISKMLQALIGNAITGFSNANAAIGVGDSSTAAAATQTDLSAVTNKLRKAMDATYPQHTDGATASNATVTFRSTFASADANFAWNEWGVFNSVTAGAGTMLNRKVESLGTKASGSTWQLTITITLA